MIYLALLLALTLLGTGSAVVMQHVRIAGVRSAEAELLAIGLEFRRALQSYAEATPVGFPTAPETLEELLRDPRQPGVRRHLRRVYPDPLTGKAEWGIVRGPDRRIVGLHSLSHSESFKRDGFTEELGGLAGIPFHDGWIFGVATGLPAGTDVADNPGFAAARTTP